MFKGGAEEGFVVGFVVVLVVVLVVVFGLAFEEGTLSRDVKQKSSFIVSSSSSRLELFMFHLEKLSFLLWLIDSGLALESKHNVLSRSSIQSSLKIL